jgi:hypothetical protein
MNLKDKASILEYQKEYQKEYVARRTNKIAESLSIFRLFVMIVSNWYKMGCCYAHLH